MMKKIFKYLLGFILGVTALFGLLFASLYFAPVQNFLKNKLETTVARKTGMTLDIERIRLAFPLKLTVDDALVLLPDSDTLLRCGTLEADVALWPLLRREIVLRKFALDGVKAHYRDSAGRMDLRADIGRFRLRTDTVDLGSRTVALSDVRLDDGKVELHTSPSATDTTVADTASGGWKIRSRSIRTSNVDFTMTASPDTMLIAASLASGRIEDGAVDMDARRVAVRNIVLSDGRYSVLSDTTKQVVRTEETPDADTIPWTVSVGHIVLEDNAVEYGALRGEPREGFDPAHIVVTGLSLEADSIYNRGSDVRGVIDGLSLRERCGLQVRSMRGAFAMDSSSVRLDGLRLETLRSEITATLSAATALSGMSAATPVTAALSASIDPEEIVLFVPSAENMRKTLAGKPLTLEGRMDGTLSDLRIERLRVDMRDHIELNARGRVSSLTDLRSMGGNVRVDATFARLDFLLPLLPDTAWRKRLHIPERIVLKADVQAQRGTFRPDIRIEADLARIALGGEMNLRNESYRAELSCDSLPLGRWLPEDSLGMATLRLDASGRGFAPFDTATVFDGRLEIGRFDYRGFDYGEIALQAALREHVLEGTLSARNTALQAELGLDGTLKKEKQTLRIAGTIDSCDLRAMNLLRERCLFSLKLDLAASASENDAYTLDLKADDIFLSDKFGDRTFQAVTARAYAGSDKVEASLGSGDLTLSFFSPQGTDSLVAGFARTADVISEQIRLGDLDMDSVRLRMPVYRLDITAGRDNPLNRFLAEKGTRFKKLSLRSSTSDGRPFSAGATVEKLSTGGLLLDTLSVAFRQQDERLQYFLRLANSPGNMDNVALVALSGHAAGNRAVLECLQKTRDGKTGFRFGLDAVRSDTAVRVSMFPEHPTLGFDTWNIAADNHVTYLFDRQIDADFILTRQEQHIRLETVPHDGPGRKVELDMSGIDIGRTLELFPAAPALEGILGANLFVHFADAVQVEGSVSVDEFRYGKNRVGDLALALRYRPSAEGGQQAGAELSIDGQKALTVQGVYGADAQSPLDFTVSLPGLPLAAANAFLPSGTAELSGSLQGEIAVTGASARPELNGALQLADTRVQVPMIGTTFGLSSERIAIRDNVVRFDRYAVTAPNRQPLTIDGTVALGDFSRIVTDLRIHAEEFQAVDVERNRRSLVYGKAFLDIDASVRGAVDELTVRGDVGLLGGTQITYVMKDSPLEVENRTQNMVEFVSFSDTTSLDDEPDSVRTIRIGGMDLLANVRVSDEARLVVNLSDDGQNRIDLTGGGNLTYTMNRLGDARFSGKYVIADGTVRYHPPVISGKTFRIRQGSYVEWVGDIADPMLNITAVETIRTTVSMEDQPARSVDFDVIVRIRNTLESLSVVFDLAAPEDLALQNQLSSMTAEQRASQAMSLLIYNTYTGPGTTAKANSSNALNSFIQKELNQWAQNNLKGVDLSFGIDTYDDASAGAKGTRTDYSYRLSKSLFGDRVKAVIGGKVSSDADPDENLRENLIDDISLEYRLTKRDNMFLKLFRHTGYESILEGEVTETGVGFVIRKKMLKITDLFRLVRNRQKNADSRTENPSDDNHE